MTKAYWDKCKKVLIEKSRAMGINLLICSKGMCPWCGQDSSRDIAAAKAIVKKARNRKLI